MVAFPPSPPVKYEAYAEVARKHSPEEVWQNYRKAGAFMQGHFKCKKVHEQNLYSGTQISQAEFLIRQGKLKQAQNVILYARKLAAAAIDGRVTLLNCDRLTALIEQKLAGNAPA